MCVLNGLPERVEKMGKNSYSSTNPSSFCVYVCVCAAAFNIIPTTSHLTHHTSHHHTSFYTNVSVEVQVSQDDIIRCVEE